MRDLADVWRPALEAGQLTFGGNVDHLTFALKAVGSADVVPLLLKQLTEGTVPRRSKPACSLRLLPWLIRSNWERFMPLCLDENVQLPSEG